VIDKEIRFLRQYLGPFWPEKQVPKEEMEKVAGTLPEMASIYVEGNQDFLRKVGAVFLLKWGRQPWLFKRSYDFVEDYLGVGDDDQPRSITEDTPGVLVIMHVKNTMVNKQLENMLIHVLENRRVSGHITCFFAEERMKRVWEFYSANKLKIIEMKTVGGVF